MPNTQTHCKSEHCQDKPAKAAVRRVAEDWWSGL